MASSHGTNEARTGNVVAWGSSDDAINTYPGPLTTHGALPARATVSVAAIAR